MFVGRTLLRRFSCSLFPSTLRRMASSTVADPKVDLPSPENEEKNLKRPAESLNSENQVEAKKVRVRRKKVAFLMGYCGQGYLGMQRNIGYKTIEEDLFHAFVKTGIMDEESSKTPQLIQFQRAARTDKGVSAAKQIISLKIDVTEENIIEKISEHLPKSIKVFDLKRVTGGFSSKLACDARMYSYVTPTFAFAPTEELVKEDYQITPEIVEKVNSTLALFTGTHNFHNFTSRRLAHDPSVKRYIMEFKCSQPFMVKNMEFVKIQVKGQSFMLHQIRKMVGLTIAILRGFASIDAIEKAFRLERMDIPIAPSLNLMLEEPLYTSYNKRYGKDGMHEALEWSSVEDKVKEFCDNHILPVIYQGEIEEKSMFNWLSTLPLHTYDVREDGAPHRSQTRSELGKALVGVQLENLKKDQDSEKSDSDS